MGAHTEAGALAIPALPEDGGNEIPSLYRHATERDIASYMKAFKACVHNIDPVNKQRLAVSIQEAIVAREFSTDKLNFLIRDPSVRITFSQPESREVTMQNQAPQTSPNGAVSRPNEQDAGDRALMPPPPLPSSRVRAGTAANNLEPPAGHAGTDRPNTQAAGQLGPANVSFTPPVTPPLTASTPQLVSQPQAGTKIKLTAEEAYALKDVPRHLRIQVLQRMRQMQSMNPPGPPMQSPAQGTISAAPSRPQTPRNQHGSPSLGSPINGSNNSPARREFGGSPQPQTTFSNQYATGHASPHAPNPSPAVTNRMVQNQQYVHQSPPMAQSYGPRVHAGHPGHPGQHMMMPPQSQQMQNYGNSQMGPQEVSHQQMEMYESSPPRMRPPPPPHMGRYGPPPQPMRSHGPPHAHTGSYGTPQQHMGPHGIPHQHMSQYGHPQQQPHLARDNNPVHYANHVAGRHELPAQQSGGYDYHGFQPHANRQMGRSATPLASQMQGSPPRQESAAMRRYIASIPQIVTPIQRQPNTGAQLDAQSHRTALGGTRTIAGSQDNSRVANQRPPRPVTQQAQNRNRTTQLDSNSGQELHSAQGAQTKGGAQVSQSPANATNTATFGSAEHGDKEHGRTQGQLQTDGLSQDAQGENNEEGDTLDHGGSASQPVAAPQPSVVSSSSPQIESAITLAPPQPHDFGAVWDELLGTWIWDTDFDFDFPTEGGDVAGPTNESEHESTQTNADGNLQTETIDNVETRPEEVATENRENQNEGQTLPNANQQPNEAEQSTETAVESDPAFAPQASGKCAHGSTSEGCCLRFYRGQHPDMWSMLQPMIRHNCVVYDRTHVTHKKDLGHPVVALYPELVGQSAEVHYPDPAKTILQVPVVHVPENLRFLPSWTTFQNGAIFFNDPVGMAEYSFTGHIIADGPLNVPDEELRVYRSFFGLGNSNAVIGRNEARAKRLLDFYQGRPRMEHDKQWDSLLSKQNLQWRSLRAVQHQPGTPFASQPHSNSLLLSDPNLLPKAMLDEDIGLVDAMAGANALNRIAQGYNVDMLNRIPKDLTNKEQRGQIHFTDIVHLSRVPNIFELIHDAAHVRVNPDPARSTVRYESKILVILALELCRDQPRSHRAIVSTLRRLVPHFEAEDCTEETLGKWRLQLLTDLAKVRFNWILRNASERDSRVQTLLQMLETNDSRLFETERIDDIDTLGLTMTLEEMLRLAATVSQMNKRGRDDEDGGQPSAKRART